MSDAGRARKIEIFAHALELEGEAQRAYLDEACGDDADLRASVDRLLDSHRAAGRFLETPAVELGAPAMAASQHAADFSGRAIGSYRLLSRIGGGGMGSVYLAERADSAFEKRVAVKLVHPGMSSAEILRRFDNERQVLASLEHPNIARLIDGGMTDDGVPFIVMEHVEGEAIDAYCRRRSLPVEARLRIFVDVCNAVHYAHKRLVVHRDLKPSNILVTDDGTVKLLDFGIAKVLGGPHGSDLTRSEMRVMTPRYASPEQIRGEAVTTSSDVYALGILMYEILTGAHPFADPDTPPRKIERAICESEPQAPSTRARTSTEDTGLTGPDLDHLSRRLRGDLDTIVLMALRKEPDRRYGSAQQLAEDVKRHLSGDPVTARPDTLRYVAGKFVRRHAVSVGVVGTLAVIILAAAVVSTTLFLRANAAQRESERQRRSAQEIASFLEDMLGSIHPATAQGRDVTILREILDRASSRIDTELASDAPAAASLHLTMGSTYLGIAQYGEAERHLTRAVALRRAEVHELGVADEVNGTEMTGATVAGADGEKLAALSDALVQLGRLYYGTSRFSAAAATQREARALASRAGKDHRAREASATSSLALALEALGEAEEADSCYKATLAMRRELLAEAPDDTVAIAGLAAAILNVGSFLTYYGNRPDAERRAEAEPLVKESIDLARRSGDRLVLVDALGNYADLMKRIGRYEEAEAPYAEALELVGRLYGRDHPRYASTLNSLAALYEFRGDHEQAEPTYREALRIQTATLGPENRAVGTTCNNLGGLLRKMGRYAEADTCLGRAVETYKIALGAEHAWVAIALNNHAAALLLDGQLERAEQVASEALRVTNVSMPDSPPRLAEAELTLGRVHLARGRYAEAETLLTSSLAHFTEHFDDDNERVQDALDKLVALYAKTGRAELEAEMRARLAGPDGSR